MGYSKIPNYKTLSEGYLKGLTREEMLFKYGIKGSMSLNKYSRKNTIRLKILKFYLIADTVNNYYKANPSIKLDEKFIKRIVAKKTGYSEHSCAVTISSLFNTGYKFTCQFEHEKSIVTVS
jgi:hypothetical protein